MKLILASGSPRRSELLAAAGVEFEVIPSPAEEIHDSSLGMAGLCEENARLKASAIAIHHPDAVVIGADTLVFLDREPLGKPKDMAEAESMLRRLSGKTNQVCTGVCIMGPSERVTMLHAVTNVFFRELDDETLFAYLAKTQPLDKAGAYGIQDHGEMIIERIVGAFDNVMGLPVEQVLQALEMRRADIPVR
ncbi:MAG: Maf family protein [Verrucomicrobiota bacterium]